jgi:hypothetical protein
MHMYFEHPVNIFHHRCDTNGLEEKHLFVIEGNIDKDERLNSYYELALGLKNFTHVNYKRLNLLGIKNNRQNMKYYLSVIYSHHFVPNMQKTAPKKDKELELKIIRDQHVDRVYFHSVTGRLRDTKENDNDYEVSPNERVQFLEDVINDYVDICEADKALFKLWNRHIFNNDEFPRRKYKTVVTNFIDENLNELFPLKECLMLHLLTLYDQLKLNGTELKECIEYAAELLNK